MEKSEWSQYTSKIAEEHNLTPPKQEKLIADLHDKINYPVHHSLLVFILQLGVELVAVHRAIR